MFNTPEENLTEFKLILFLVWTNSSVCSDNTKLHLAGSICRNSKVLQKHQHVTSKHNAEQSKTQEHNQEHNG